MKNKLSLLLIALSLIIGSCNSDKKTTEESATSDAVVTGGQEAVKDDESAKDVVKVAVGSKDHTTLVAALKQADLVTSLSNAGPFTVFAPNDDAFLKLPKGTASAIMNAKTEEDKMALYSFVKKYICRGSFSYDSLKTMKEVKNIGDNSLKIESDAKGIKINGVLIIKGDVKAKNGLIHVLDDCFPDM